jgi:hypothetical protein
VGAEVLLARLAGVKARGPGRWIARCPAHKDCTPSLSIREEPDGRILIHDFGHCSVFAVLEAVDLKVADLFPEPVRRNEHETTQERRLRQAAERQRLHTHAAADALKVIAREALIVRLVAEDLAAGLPITPDRRERMLQAYLRISGAARVV